MLPLILLFSLIPQNIATDGYKGLYETSGFHCYSRDSMRLPRHLHGKPQTTEPPFDLSVYDEHGKRVESYEIGKIYTVKLEAYVHFRGLMLQSRLCTPSGAIIGSLRGGKFIEDEQFESHGIMFHQCGRLVTNDSLTHSGDEKKFLAEAKWQTTRDIGNVQFVATIATENVVYWERWRPRHAFLKGPYQKWSIQNPNIFVYNLEKDMEQRANEKVVTAEPILPSQHPLFEEQKEFLKGKMKMETVTKVPKRIEETSEDSDDVFDFDGIVFENTVGPSTPDGKKIQVTAASMMMGDATDVTRVPEITQSSKFVIEQSIPSESSFMVGRMFKKFAPLNDTVLREDDLKFLNSHAHHLQHDFVDNNDVEVEEKCQNSPCQNGGTCSMSKGNVKCECPRGFVGALCSEVDKCVENECENNSTCFNDKTGGYSCKCQNGTVGKLCEIQCPLDQCQNGGRCYLNTFGKLACKCLPGTTGRKCEREINECGWNKCQNGAKCVDLFNDYKCECADGWMGRNCERPCQDIYGSCRVWKREGQCDLMRNTTEFFDINCAASCEICVKLDNFTDTSYLPLQPILMPFAWLLGEWQSTVKGWNNHTTDYPNDMDGMAYNETITFSVAPSLSFGTPYINYTATMTSLDDPSNIHQYSGFLTIQQYKDENQTSEKGALTSVSNTGLIMIEEGEIQDEKTSSEGTPTLWLTPTYQYFKSETDVIVKNASRHPERSKRWFTVKNKRLMQYMVREFKGRTHKFTKIYKKTQEFKYL